MSATSTYQIGQLVRLKELSNAIYNGKLGKVRLFPSLELIENGRYRVELIDAVDPPLLRELSVKPETMERVCVRCHNGGEKLSSCGKCRHTFYCNRECQRMDWERHKTECRYNGHIRDTSKNPLYLAVMKMDLAGVRKLVQEGIDVNMASNTTGGSALMAAVMVNSLPIMQYLLQHGADKDMADIDGAGPLHVAAQFNHLPMLRFLLEQGADKDKVDNNGYSPLYIAALSGKLAAVKCLLENGADKDKAGNKGTTPLYVTAQQGHLPVVRCLVEHGVD